MLFLRWIFVDGFFHHVIELLFDLGRITFLFAGDVAPYERVAGGIAQVDNQRSFSEGNVDDEGAKAAPACGVGFLFYFPCGSKSVYDVQIGLAGGGCESLAYQVFLNAGFDALLDKVVIQRWIVTTPASVSARKGFIF